MPGPTGAGTCALAHSNMRCVKSVGVIRMRGTENRPVPFPKSPKPYIHFSGRSNLFQYSNPYSNHLEYKPITPGYIPPFLGSFLRPSLKSKTQNSILRILIRVGQTLLEFLKILIFSFSISCATEIGESPGATQYPFYFKSMWEKMPIARLSDLHRVKQPTT